MESPRVPTKTKVHCVELQDHLAHLPFHLRLMAKIQWWMAHVKDRKVINLVRHGVYLGWLLLQTYLRSLMAQSRNISDQGAAREILAEYLEIGAIKRVEMQEVKFLSLGL